MKQTPSDITLHDFIRCLFHHEYKVLIDTEKDVTEAVLSEVWQSIYEQYCIISGSLDHVKIMKCLNEIIRLQKILLHGNASIFVLCYEYSEPDIEVLKKIGFNYEFSKTDYERFKKDVENCAKKLKGFDLQLQVQQKKRLELFGFDENGNQKNNKQQQTEGDFIKSVAIVGKSNGYHISLKNTMLDEWAGMVKLHNEMNKK
jgi:hypothetical protein